MPKTIINVKIKSNICTPDSETLLFKTLVNLKYQKKLNALHYLENIQIHYNHEIIFVM